MKRGAYDTPQYCNVKSMQTPSYVILTGTKAGVNLELHVVMVELIIVKNQNAVCSPEGQTAFVFLEIKKRVVTAFCLFVTQRFHRIEF